ncbi:hypothetical protein N9Y42_08870, partial [Mariniblastus sp.]|nr:hypothetical protein [Mariniblastus sp.]
MMKLFAIGIARTSCFMGAIAALIMFAPLVQADIIIDDFTGAPGGTATVILDDNGGVSNTTTFLSESGSLEVNTTAYDGIEQIAYIYSGFSLGIGDELQADFSLPIAGNRNFGLYVGGTAPTTSVRQDYIT